jgi:hypothetical protein
MELFISVLFHVYVQLMYICSSFLYMIYFLSFFLSFLSSSFTLRCRGIFTCESIRHLVGLLGWVIGPMQIYDLLGSKFHYGSEASYS